MKLQEFKDKAEDLINQIEVLIHTMPQKGDISTKCQRIYLQQNLNELQYAFNGTEQSDLPDKGDSYVLGDNSINGVTLNDKIHDEELHEYSIIDRTNFIDELINWISEATGSNKYMMKEDLEMLMSWDDDYILSSNSTNSYIGADNSKFNETCKELVELSLKLDQ
jgi:polyhydroxyalkanoate synthesis regulator phasin